MLWKQLAEEYEAAPADGRAGVMERAAAHWHRLAPEELRWIADRLEEHAFLDFHWNFFSSRYKPHISLLESLVRLAASLSGDRAGGWISMARNLSSSAVERELLAILERSPSKHVLDLLSRWTRPTTAQRRRERQVAYASLYLRSGNREVLTELAGMVLDAGPPHATVAGALESAAADPQLQAALEQYEVVRSLIARVPPPLQKRWEANLDSGGSIREIPDELLESAIAWTAEALPVAQTSSFAHRILNAFPAEARLPDSIETYLLERCIQTDFGDMAELALKFFDAERIRASLLHAVPIPWECLGKLGPLEWFREGNQDLLAILAEGREMLSADRAWAASTEAAAWQLAAFSGLPFREALVGVTGATLEEVFRPGIEKGNPFALLLRNDADRPWIRYRDSISPGLQLAIVVPASEHKLLLVFSRKLSKGMLPQDEVERIGSLVRRKLEALVSG